jgi:hypothetical protein
MPVGSSASNKLFFVMRKSHQKPGKPAQTGRILRPGRLEGAGKPRPSYANAQFLAVDEEKNAANSGGRPVRIACGARGGGEG